PDAQGSQRLRDFLRPGVVRGDRIAAKVAGICATATAKKIAGLSFPYVRGDGFVVEPDDKQRATSSRPSSAETRTSRSVPEPCHAGLASGPPAGSDTSAPDGDATFPAMTPAEGEDPGERPSSDVTSPWAQIAR